MTQQSTKRWFAGNVSNQLNRRRIESHRNGDRLVLLGSEHRLEFEVAVENLATGSVNAAHGGPELGVRVGRNVLGEEVQQAAIAAYRNKPR